MAATIITVEDIEKFRTELLVGTQKLLSQAHPALVRKWLKSAETENLLSIQWETLTFRKIGAVVYYDYDDIWKMIEAHRCSSYSLKQIDPKSKD